MNPGDSDVDQPAAALVKDLKARGLLEDTLVIFGGEFSIKLIRNDLKTFLQALNIRLTLSWASEKSANLPSTGICSSASIG